MSCLKVIICALCLALSYGKMIDLTHTYNNKTMVSPRVFPMQFEAMNPTVINLGDGKSAKVLYNKFTMPEHLGTHMDAPSHVVFDDKPSTAWSVDQIPIDRLVGPAVVIDISKRAAIDPDAELNVNDLNMWEERYGRIKDGSIVMINAGWNKNWGYPERFFGNAEGDSSRYHFPGCGKDAAEWLVSNRNINGVAVETLSLDSGKNIKKKYAHLILLPANIYGLENVANMDQLPPNGARLYVSCMKIAGGSGGPCRLFAEIGRDMPPKFNSGTRSFGLCYAIISFVAMLAVVLY